MPSCLPSPDTLHPVILPDGTPHAGTVFLRAVIDHPRWQIGEYSYASAHHPPDDWAFALAPYLYPFSAEYLTIGKFCQIADGVMFITSSANHRHDGFSSFPFAIFHRNFGNAPSLPAPGPDTVIGNDVWIGQGARILPGAQIGDGVIIGSGAVVGGKIAPYQVVAGNPARVVRSRFSPDVIARLCALRWWDWPTAHILRHEAAICGGDIGALERAADDLVAR
ncbi:CatB-related O-acetyltransferase [Roseinatronobacter alkalisoli]|uniref:CatB-related O-acetyltransferase n=1 Tax=Roseinatronobacter alkalisoli TaxID=3028235 RepID=A0ABT5T6M7_9RHOB|nr:CatB-related O-acetyltransferase [Roseinatronobacter sp. HJB301]MDD7970594.1 CatB-related O-acetyltransferase [Roseinatronobacter sp. HJB301]